MTAVLRIGKLVVLLTTKPVATTRSERRLRTWFVTTPLRFDR